MNNAIKYVLAGAAVYGLVLLSTGKKMERRLNALRLQIKDVDIDLERIRFTINVQNPNTGTLIIRSVVGDLFINGSKVANVSSFGDYTIAGNGQNTLPIEAKFKIQNAANAIAQFLNGKSRNQLSMIGSMNMNNELIPMTLTYTINA